MCTCVCSNFSAIATHSSIVDPAIFAKITVPFVSKFGSSRSINASIPGFCRPTEFNIPLGDSAILGDGFPNLGVIVVPFVAMPPNFESGNNSSYSLP